jgi:oxygen-independent coproporphyrinogen-3 oxidase
MLQEALPRLAPFASRGLLRMADDVVIITGAGLPYARSIAAQFDVYRKDSLRRFSSAV